MLLNNLKQTLRRSALVVGIGTLLCPMLGTASTDVSQALLDEIAQNGSARVLVGLDTPFTPEGLLTSEQVAAQRTAITDKQTTFNADLANDIKDSGLIDFPSSAGSEPDLTAYRFETIPYVVAEVNTVSLPFFQASSHIDSIKLSVVDQPSLDDVVSITGADKVHTAGFGGAGQTIAVLDTGAPQTSQFEACFSSSRSCPNGAEIQFNTNAGAPCDFAGCEHGETITNVLSTLAPEATIIPIQIASYFPQMGASFPGENQVRALEYVYGLHQSGKQTFTAVNMSLGSGQYNGTCNGSATKNEDARLAMIQNLVSQGVAVVAAAGNDGYMNSMHKPACYEEVISVGATDKLGDIWTGSNRSAVLDLLAPGVDIEMTLVSGETVIKEGTSLAAPVISAFIALVKEAKPDFSLNEVVQRLKTTADWHTGFPQPRIDAAILSEGSDIICTIEASNGGHFDVVTEVTFTHDGKYAISASEDHTIRIYNAQTCSLERVLEGHTNWVTSIDVSLDDKTLITGSRDKTVKVWNLETGEVLNTFNSGSIVSSVKFVPNTQQVVVSTITKASDRNLILLNANTGEQVCAFDDHDQSVQKVQISSDGNMALSGSSDGKAVLWTMNGCQKVREFVGQNSWGKVLAVAFAPNNSFILTAAEDGAIIKWDTETGTELHSFPIQGVNSNINSLMVSPDGQSIIASYNTNVVKMWGVNGEELHTFAGHENNVRSSAFSPDGSKMVSGGLDGKVIIWRVPNEYVSAVSEKCQDENLVSCFLFEGNLQDSSGNNNHGTEHGGISYREGQNGASLILDGENDYGEITQPINFEKEFSISFMLKAESDGYVIQMGEGCQNENTAYNGTSYIIYKGGHYTGAYTSTGFGYLNARVTEANGNFFDDRIITTTNEPIPNKLIHVVVTFLDNSLKIYIDGELANSSTFMEKGGSASTENILASDFSMIHQTTATLKIGASESYCSGEKSYGQHLKGLIDELRFFNRSLSETEIQQLYQLDQSAFMVSLTVNTEGSGTIQTSDNKLNCSNTCQADYLTDEVVNLTAQPAANQQFSHWSGNCSGTNANINVTMDTVKNCTAHFVSAAAKATMTIEKRGRGAIHVKGYTSCWVNQSICTFEANIATTLQVIADPSNDYEIAGWAGECLGYGNATDVNLTLNQDVNCTITFNPLPDPDKRILTLKITGEGEVKSGGHPCSYGTCQFSYPLDQKVWLQISPATGHQFVKFVGENCPIADSTVKNIVMANDYTCHAIFAPEDIISDPDALADIIERAQMGDAEQDVADIYPTAVLDEALYLLKGATELVDRQVDVQNPTPWVEHLIDVPLYTSPAGQYVDNVMIKEQHYIVVYFIDNAYPPIAVIYGEIDNGIWGGWYGAFFSRYYTGSWLKLQ